jgi:hypothetical protein
MPSPARLRTVPAARRPDSDRDSRFSATRYGWLVRSVIFWNKERQPQPNDGENEQYGEKEQ